MLSLLRKAALFLLVPILVLAVYDAPIFYSRWRYTRNEERSIRAAEAEDARRTIAMLGGGELKILNFYGTNAIRRGEHFGFQAAHRWCSWHEAGSVNRRGCTGWRGTSRPNHWSEHC